jgi:hypothetical protein
VIRGESDLLLPAGSRLLHIGPHKTGTTSVQSAFHTHRDELAAQGVRYAGTQRQPMQAAHAVTGRASPYADGKTPPIRRWLALVREIRGAREDRVVVSSEGFTDADAAAVRRVIGDLGVGQVHVVVTLRPLVELLPSQWQQQVQSGMTMAYEDWLEAVFNDPTNRVSQGFWHRHRHDELVRRWASEAGAGALTAIVVDGADRDRVLRTLESMVGLRAGTLIPEPELSNRSLTLAEVETIRAFNAAFRAEGLGTQLHAKVMRFGAAELMKRRTPEPAEPRIQTPSWAVDRAAEVGREIVEGIRSSGVRVVGDLASLVAPSSRAAGGAVRKAPAVSVAARRAAEEAWPRIGATAALGIVLASGLARDASSVAGVEDAWPDGPLDRGALPPRPRVEPLELARVSTPLLGLVLVRRLVGAAASRLPLPRRAG